MNETKVDAVVVTYNPEITLLRENVHQISMQVATVFIVDNGSGNIDSITDDVARQFSNVEVIKLRTNKGIAAAQNVGFSAAIADHAKWVLTMDQDSVFPLNGVDVFINSKESNNPNVGIIAPNFYDDRIGIHRKEEESVVNVDFTISSGNLVLVKAWQDAGGFDEWMFIDYVDFDFNAKLARLGYKIVKFNNVMMKHELGIPPKNRPLLKKLLLFDDDAPINDHSAFRQYYYYRNTLVFWKRYPELLDKQRQAWHSKHLFISLLSSLRRVFLFEDTNKKLFMALKGLAAGIIYRPGYKDR